MDLNAKCFFVKDITFDAALLLCLLVRVILKYVIFIFSLKIKHLIYRFSTLKVIQVQIKS